MASVTDKERKGSRRKRQTSSSSTSLSGMIPSKLVCTAQGLQKSKDSMEVGVVISILIVLLYVYGFIQSMTSLPDLAHPRRVLGAPLNLPRLPTTSRSDSTTSLDVPKSPGNGGETSSDGRKENKGGGMGRTENDGDTLIVPDATWPYSIQDESIENQEMMIHPGNKKTELWVPKFWSPPLHNKKQFTREMAMKIGTCAEPDPVTGLHVRGDSCPQDQRTIFIAIASYRDFQCRYTVESAFQRAKNPERIRVGTLDVYSLLSLWWYSSQKCRKGYHHGT